MDSKEIVMFKGLMAPVFTPFDGQEAKRVNYGTIKLYAKYLCSKGIKAVLVNGTSGEGTSLTLEERKTIVTQWKISCTELKMLLMVQVAGGAMVDTIEMAKHCTDQKVDGVLVLPDLFFKPKNCEELLDYMVDVSYNCSNIPIYYYHIPAYTGVNLPMDVFMELARRQLPAFAGIKFTSGDMEMGIKCLGYGQVFLGADTILCGALALGFDCAIMTSLNIHPEYAQKIIEYMGKGEVKEALAQQKKLNDFVKRTMARSNNLWVTGMKRAFNELTHENELLNMGIVRRPIQLPIAYRNL